MREIGERRYSISQIAALIGVTPERVRVMLYRGVLSSTLESHIDEWLRHRAASSDLKSARQDNGRVFNKWR